jgi:predicted peroxiredoxin
MHKAVVSLNTGLEDAETVTVAFLVAVGAAEQGRPTLMFLTKEAVRLAVPGHAVAVACEGCPPLERIFEQFTQNGGELIACPFCVNARRIDPDDFVPNARVGGATPMFDWLGDEGGQVFSY